MENTCLTIVCLTFLCIGTIGVFSTEGLIHKINKKAGFKTLQVVKTVGYAVCLVALIVIYILIRGEI